MRFRDFIELEDIIVVEMADMTQSLRDGEAKRGQDLRKFTLKRLGKLGLDTAVGMIPFGGALTSLAYDGGEAIMHIWNQYRAGKDVRNLLVQMMKISDKSPQGMNPFDLDDDLEKVLSPKALMEIAGKIVKKLDGFRGRLDKLPTDLADRVATRWIGMQINRYKKKKKHRQNSTAQPSTAPQQAQAQPSAAPQQPQRSLPQSSNPEMDAYAQAVLNPPAPAQTKPAFA